jgi:hypothetical protein
MPSLTNQDWKDLEDSIKAAALTLGYDEAVWDGNGVLEVEGKDWEELTEEQQKAAEILGMDEDDWDEDGTNSL